MSTPASSRRPARHLETRATHSRAILSILAGLLLALALAAPALAHAELVSSDPADGAVLDAPPGVVVLAFNDRLVAARSFFELVPLAGGPTQRGELDPNRPRRLQLALATALSPGDYEVRWRAMADDGHAELKRGIVRFTVLAPTPSPETPLPPTAMPGGTSEPATLVPPTTAATEAPAATPSATPAPVDPALAASTGDVILPIVAGLALVAAVGAYVLRRSRRT